MSKLVESPLASSATLHDLLSPEERARLEAYDSLPLDSSRARQVLTGCYLMIAHRFKSAPVCVLDFRKIKAL